MQRPDNPPRIPMIFEDHHVAVTPFETGFRVGSTMEFTGYDRSLNPRRLDLLRKSAANRPHIVVVASQVTNAPFARAEAYGASKAALQYFFDSLRIDLAPENIDVSVVNPGFVDTPLTRKNDFDMPFLMDVDDAVQRIIKQLASRPRSYSFPKRLQALLLMSRLMPGTWQKMVSRDISKSTPKIQPSQDSKQ